VRRFSLATAPTEPYVEVLDEERVRDQLSAAEELMYLGHREPALVATGAALEGALRLRGGSLAGHSASAGALLEALLATMTINDSEHERLYRVLTACERLAHGYAPDLEVTLSKTGVEDALAIVIRMLEGLPQN
jgi:hypothetical protein